MTRTDTRWEETPHPYGGDHDRAVVEALADDLAALSARQRLHLLLLLRRPRSPAEVADALDISEGAAQAHLAELEARGFVRSSPEKGAFLAVPPRLFTTGATLGDLVKLDSGAVEGLDDTVMVTAGGILVSDKPPVPTASHLLVVTGPDAGLRFALTVDRQRWTIGRNDDRDLRLSHDPFVSGAHAEVFLDRLGAALVDVFSANGTFLNFVRLPRGGRVPLKPGDVVGVGHTVLVYQRE